MDSSSSSINGNSTIQSMEPILEEEMIRSETAILDSLRITDAETESRTVSAPELSSASNGTISVPLPVSNGPVSGSQQPNGFVATSRPASPVHQPRPFNHSNQHNQPRQFWRGNGSNSRGGSNGVGFQNQNYSNRGRQDGFQNQNYSNRGRQDGFQNRNHSNRRQNRHGYNQNQWFNNAGPPRFAYGPARFLGPPNQQPFPPHSTPIANHGGYINVPYLAPPPPPPPPPTLRAPPMFPLHVMPYYNDPYLQGVDTSSYFPPLVAQVPYVENMTDPLSYPQPPGQPNLPDSEEKCNNILKQIEYYFSDENLRKDYYLRQHMDEEGWVSIHLIAGFNKIKPMTDDISLILRALEPSEDIEMQDEKVRKRGSWMNWILPH